MMPSSTVEPFMCNIRPSKEAMTPLEAQLSDWVKQAPCSRRHEIPYYGFYLCTKHLKELLATSCAWQREQDAKVAWLISGEPNQSKAIAQGKGKRYQWQRDQYQALADSAREIATAIRANG